MKKKRLILLAIFFSAIQGCSVDEQVIANADDSPGKGISSKFVNTDKDSDPSQLIIQLRQEYSSEIESALIEAGAASIEPLFNMQFGNVEKKKAAGMDRFYVLNVATGSDCHLLARAAAKVAEVEHVQYSTNYYRASDCVPHPLEQVKIGPQSIQHVSNISTVFNDPQLGKQWHYANYGNKGYNPNAYAGADINVADVWKNLCTGDKSIIVAVIDEGVKYTHPDLAGNMWINTAEKNGTAGVDDDGNGYIDDIYGYNFVDNGDISWDKVAWDANGNVDGERGDVGHGTHCAGTISAINNNGRGVSGIAGGNGSGNGVRIMSCQIFSGGGSASSVNIARAVEYAKDMGASVISCSFGSSAGAFRSDAAYLDNAATMAEYLAVQEFESTVNSPALSDGSIAIFAAGNDGQPYSGYPGALADIISVSAFAPDFWPTYYTNYGQGCNITAPGGEIAVNASNKVTYEGEVLSTMPSEIHARGAEGSDYGYMQGTSMACPHVSGVVALGLSYALKLGKSFTVKQFKNMILSSSQNIDNRINAAQTKIVGFTSNPTYTISLSNYRGKMGTGCIDAWALMMKIEGIPTHIVTLGKRQWLDLSDYFGTSSTALTYLGLEVSDEARQALGFAEEPELKYGRLYVHPTKIGSCKITVKAIAGGTSLGGGDRPTGGMEMSQEISIIARPEASANGSWL
ncbi:MAG: S8 family serine peptidase [Bacteroidales bacterium]|nr:S8 family serine peptidase [Bacteroidales bacterium]